MPLMSFYCEISNIFGSGRGIHGFSRGDTQGSPRALNRTSCKFLHINHLHLVLTAHKNRQDLFMRCDKSDVTAALDALTRKVSVSKTKLADFRSRNITIREIDKIDQSIQSVRIP